MGQKRIVSDEFFDGLDGGSEVLRSARHGNIERLRQLFAENPEAREDKGHMGRRPLHVAVESANPQLVEFLLQAGVDVDGTRERGDTPLCRASTAEIANLLLRAGASLHTKDFAGREPVHWAAQFAHPDVLKVFLEQGADVHVRDENDNTPLHWATGAAVTAFGCQMTNTRPLECVEILVRCGADVNGGNTAGNVPLHGVVVLPNMEQRLTDGSLKFPPRHSRHDDRNNPFAP